MVLAMALLYSSASSSLQLDWTVGQNRCYGRQSIGHLLASYAPSSS
ncbi:uncharacterized protein FFB20_05364 [Fusarium fujikuroi]|nr:uncharacterized protein FFB20_05364 [Fusarium fujikuroi]SCO19249.1 uncharacterized protein FFE2_14233 [Fusarium fujikuroi]SCO24757.1 uncharacterized protein FFM5_13775 [Fusarium fujikuroi]SCO25443.1 uncharacterized protein FFC1_15527 [Fusarium fujikuroi]SCO52367.1 uncharacterized protein FFNC_14235 [Fusarium fujikuroi]